MTTSKIRPTFTRDEVVDLIYALEDLLAPSDREERLLERLQDLLRRHDKKVPR